MVVRPYFHKGNWYETTADMSFDAYVKGRTSSSRKAIDNYARKARKLERSGRLEYRLVTNADGLEGALADYETIYPKSGGCWFVLRGKVL